MNKTTEYHDAKQGPLVSFSPTGITFDAKDAHPTALSISIDWAKVAQMAARFAPPILVTFKEADLR